MAILTHNEIIKALRRGEIKISSFEKAQIGPGSVDLTLGNDFRVFKKGKKTYHIRPDSKFEDVTRAVHVADGKNIVIRPNEMILGITRERLTLSDNVCGWLEGRSRFARFGLAVHVTAGFMQPGIDNQQVLEIVNMGHQPLALYPGTRICQFIFERTVGKAHYSGRFSKQAKP